MLKKLSSLLIILAMIFSIFGCSPKPIVEEPDIEVNVTRPKIESIVEDEIYTSPKEVAEYINTFKKLPSNYLSKKQAMDLGWESNKGNLWDVSGKGAIGGDKFGNREGLLPKEKGRIWYECDVNYEGGYRGGERLVYSSDGLIYYTSDHYKTFEQLY